MNGKEDTSPATKSDIAALQAVIEGRFEKIDERVEKVDERFDRIDDRLKIHDEQFSLLLEHLSKVEKQ